MSKRSTIVFINFISDDNDASKKYKNNFVLSDAIGNSHFNVSNDNSRNYILKDVEG